MTRTAIWSFNYVRDRLYVQEKITQPTTERATAFPW